MYMVVCRLSNTTHPSLIRYYYYYEYDYYYYYYYYEYDY